MEISSVHPPDAKNSATTRFFGEKTGYESITRFFWGKKNGLWLGTITRFFSAKNGLLTHF